jgi:hypothetical protein
MKTTTRGLGVVGLVLAYLLCAPQRGFSQQPPPPPAEELLRQPPARDATATDAVQVQTRGPIHEAYAQPVDQAPQAGPVVPKQPPDPISEVPPDQKPEGDNVQWIPGYWAWDNDRNDFLWVSGFWRAMPPGRKWVPGHWEQVQGGWQWVAGFWAPDTQDQVPYQPPPPTSLDYGPTVPAPNDDSFYVPGCWILREDRYAWRPGYWTAAQPGWVWTPAHYCYTPAGCVFVNGFWDFDLQDRGLLFAPVCFNSPVWQNPDWSFTPSYCVDVPNLLDSLFVRPDYCHYYFGDFCGPTHADEGFRPWCDYGPRYYDPLYSYARWAHRGDWGWERGLRDRYDARLHGDLPRLPHTLAEQRAFLREGRLREDHRLVSPLGRFHNDHLRLAAVGRDHILEQRRGAEHFRAVSHQRQLLERPGHFGNGRPGALPLARVPVAGGRAGRPGTVYRGGAEQHPSRSVRPELGPGYRGVPSAFEHPGYRPELRTTPAPRREARPSFERAPAPVNHGYAAHPPAYHAPQHAAPASHPRAPAWSPPHAGRPAYHPPAFHSAGHPRPAFHSGGHPAPASHGGGGGHGGGGHGGGGHGGGGGGGGGHGGGHHK